MILSSASGKFTIQTGKEMQREALMENGENEILKSPLCEKLGGQRNFAKSEPSIYKLKNSHLFFCFLFFVHCLLIFGSSTF